MKQYTFLNLTKVLYGTSLLNSIDITLTVENYLRSHKNMISFEIIESFFEDTHENQTKRLYVYDQYYVISPCEITERYNIEFKILLTTGGSITIKKNQNINKNKNLTNKKVIAKIKGQKPAVINQNHRNH